jgi:redox-regulated HSP33 family molecular chaperone
MSDDLIKQWDEYVESVGSVTVAVTHLLGRAEAAEAKLAKAVEIGNKMAASIKGNYYIPNVVAEWNAALAELEKEND